MTVPDSIKALAAAWAHIGGGTSALAQGRPFSPGRVARECRRALPSCATKDEAVLLVQLHEWACNRDALLRSEQAVTASQRAATQTSLGVLPII